MRAREIAEGAARTMSERGKCEGIRQDNQGRVCFLGAIDVFLGLLCLNRDGNPALPSQAEEITEETREGYRLVNKLAAEILYERGLAENDFGFPQVAWNNQAGTSAEDVILLFKEIAERC